jgi:2-methylisocitrate lyase-like PEP mutase family enzyme
MFSNRLAAEGLTSTELQERCERLRSLHVPGAPLVLPNAWDVASARAVADAGFPVVATTSGGVAAALGYEDHEGAPADEMLAAAGRIAGSVEVPVTVDAEAGYGLEPAELIHSLREVGAAGCNLEDTDHSTGELRDVDEQEKMLRAVRDAASAEGYSLVINARIDVFLAAMHSGSDSGQQGAVMDDALTRAHAYFEAGADCVYPIVLWERDAIERFVAEAGRPVNVLRIPSAPSLEDMASLGVARVSWGGLLHGDLMGTFASRLEAIATESAGPSVSRG